MSDKRLDNRLIRFDWAMKRILRNKADHSVLNGFLSVVLGEKVEIVEFLESESNMDHEEDKFNRVDIKALNSKGEIILIEVQNTRETEYFQRIIYGTSRAITEHIRLGQDYSAVRKVYSISIVYFSLGQGSDYAYHGTTVFRGMHNPDDILQLSERQRVAYCVDSPSDLFHEYYILKVNDFNQVASTPLEEWISFLKESVIPDSFTAPGLAEAREQLRVDQLSSEEAARYWARVDYELSQTSARNSEILGTQITIARNLKSMGLPPEQISQATGLTPQQIQML